MRHDALMEIASEFNIEKQVVEQKIKNLQSQLAREIKKTKDGNKSGSGTDDVYKSKWFAYESLRFLRDKNKTRETLDSEVSTEVDTLEDKGDVNDITENDENSHDFITTNDSTENNLAECNNANAENAEKVERTKRNTSPKKQFKSPNLDHVHSKKRKGDDPMVNDAYRMMTQVFLDRNKKDVFSVFGEEVAVTLRNLPTAYAQATVQHMISTILFEGKLAITTIQYHNSHHRNIILSISSSSILLVQ
ncbi:uncharacterized protein [Diabrotica undecimpunctata]|uniref:uncharacterized protein n=1 Tax=Diabrotica undecimpunctata TaxID=50387 RepID=UPI003B638121